MTGEFPTQRTTARIKTDPRRITRNHTRVGERKDASRETILGDLQQTSLGDVLTFLCNQSRTGQLALEQQEPVTRTAAILIDQGRVVHASCRPYEGQEAFDRLLGWTSGRYAFIAGSRPPTQTIRAELQTLLLDGLRRQDELSALLEELPGPGVAVHHNWSEPLSDALELPSIVWRVRRYVDGHRDVLQILDDTPFDPSVTAGALMELLEKRLITTVESADVLGRVVVARLPPEHRSHRRLQPLGQQANAMVRQADGTRSVAELGGLLGMSSSDLVTTLRQLVEQHWLEVTSGFEAYRDHLA